MAVSSLVALSLAFPGGSVDQGITGKVTYSSAGISAEKALKELSAKTGLTLLTAPTTANEVLAISLQEAPVKEVLVKVAWAVGGSWKREGEAYRLVRTSEDTSAEKIRERDSVIAGYAKSLAKRKADLAAAGELTLEKAEQIAKEAASRIKGFNPENRGNNNFWEFSSRLAGESPGGRAVSKLMALVTPQELADLPKGIRVVYSTQPTRTQRPLGGAATAIVAAMQREQAIWLDAMTKHQVKNPQVGNTTYMILPELQASDTEGQTRKVGKVLFTMTRASQAGGGVQMELILADTKGKVLSRGSGGVWYYGGYGEKPPAVPKDDPKVVQGADMKTMAANATRTGKINLPEELRNRLLQPEIHEPLGILAGQTILNAAKARKVNLVAALSDLSFMYAGNGLGEYPYTTWIRGQKSTNEVVEEGGWLTMRPIAAVTARAAFVDRKLMGAFLRRKATGVRMTVEESANWAARLPLEEDAPLPRVIATYTITGENQDRYGGGDGRILRFFGSLSKAQRAAAKQGGVPISTLNEDQMEIIHRLVYGENSNLQMDYQKAQEAKLDFNDFYSGLMREPTESMPNGIPPDGRIELTETTSEVAFTSDWQAEGYTRPSQGMDPAQIAWQQFAESRLDLFPYMKEPYQRVDMSKMRMGKRTTYLLTMRFTPILSLMNSLEDREYSMSQPVAFAGLPAPFRKEVERLIEDYRKQYANTTAGAATPGTHYTPPPL